MAKVHIKEKVFKTTWRIFIIIVGSIISAAGMTLLLEPHNMVSSGVSGISMLLSYVTPINAGIYVAIINIPIFIIAWRKIDLSFCIYSIIGTAILAVTMIVLSGFREDFMAQERLVQDPLVAAIFGGMLSGGGTGLVIRARASHGGTDIISVIIRQKFAIGIGMLGFYVNLFIVAILAFKFTIELGLLTIFSQFIGAKALDRVVTGFNTAKAIMIVSEKADEMSKYITKRLYRGVTLLKGEGGFEGNDKKILWCVVTTSQLARIKNAMKEIDPNAFMSISDSNEVIGHGFYKSPF